MNTKIIALLAGAGALATATAFAKHHEGKGEDHAATMEATAQAKFEAADTDASGTVSRDEYLAAKAKAAEESWDMHADYLGDDGELSWEEAEAVMADMKAKHETKMKEHKGG